MTIKMIGYGMQICTTVTNRRCAKLLKSLLRYDNKITAQGFVRLVSGGLWTPASDDEQYDFVIKISEVSEPVCWRG